MLHCHYIEENRLVETKKLDILKELETEQVIWLDLLHASQEEQEVVEEKFNVELFTRQEAEEIESSSRYSESGTEININSNFLVRDKERYGNEPVTFILRDNFLITQRRVELKTIDDAHRLDSLGKGKEGGVVMGWGWVGEEKEGEV